VRLAVGALGDVEAQGPVEGEGLARSAVTISITVDDARIPMPATVTRVHGAGVNESDTPATMPLTGRNASERTLACGRRGPGPSERLLAWRIP
jgi:hypothetical protein